MGCLLVVLILGGCTFGGFYFLGTIGAVIGFIIGLFLLGKLNAF